MPDQVSITRPLTTLRARGLTGRFKVPGDSGLFCLAAMLGLLARGETVIYTGAVEPDRDLAATLELLAAVGAPVELSDDRWHVAGLGPLGLLEPTRPLDFTGADRALPLAMGLVAPYRFTTRFISQRAQAAPSGLIDKLRTMGTEISEHRNGQLPVGLRGPQQAVPAVWQLTSSSVAAKAPLILAALGTPGVSMLEVPARAPEHAQRLLRHFGARLAEGGTENGGRCIEIAGLPALGARTLTIAGDPDIAAFAILAGLVVPNSDVLVENVPLHPSRAAVLSLLEEMGGHIEVLDRRQTAGEDVADVRVKHSPLLGIDVDTEGLAPAGVMAIAVAGAFAAGETHIPRFGFAGEDALHQRLGEGLIENGATVSLDKHGLRIGRPTAGRRLGGGTIAAGEDALLALAFLVFGLGAPEQVTIEDDGHMEAAYPGVVRSLEGVGAEFYRRWAT